MTDSARLRIAVGLAVASVLLGGCARGDSEPPTAAPPTAAPPSVTGSTSAPASTPTTPGAPEHHRPYSDVNPPPRRAGDFVVKELSLTRGAPEDDGHPRRAAKRTGPEYWGEEVRTCVRRSSHDRHVVGWDDWRARGLDGRLYPADPTGPQPLRTPVYPSRRVLAPGECVTGWWLITVPKGRIVDSIQFAPGGGRALITWKSMR